MNVAPRAVLYLLLFSLALSTKSPAQASPAASNATCKIDKTPPTDADGVHGVLGYPTLQQLVMHIDYRDNLVRFEAAAAHK